MRSGGLKIELGGFWLGKYPVTQGEWKQLMGNNPSHFRSGDRYPVEQVSWNDAQEFIGKMNSGGNTGFRLPTEAEWEYACRSGGKREKYSGGNNVDRVAWYAQNSGGMTHPIGNKEPNGLGIYDMSGNVWEWTCSDWGGYNDGKKNHAKCSSRGSYRVLRGGSWGNGPASVRSAFRGNRGPGNSNGYLGFHLSRTYR